METNNNEWESKIELNGHTYGNAKNSDNGTEKQNETEANKTYKNDENVDSEQGLEQNENATAGRKPEDPESKGITEGDKGNNPGSQDGNRGQGSEPNRG